MAGCCKFRCHVQMLAAKCLVPVQAQLEVYLPPPNHPSHWCLREIQCICMLKPATLLESTHFSTSDITKQLFMQINATDTIDTCQIYMHFKRQEARSTPSSTDLTDHRKTSQFLFGSPLADGLVIPRYWLPNGIFALSCTLWYARLFCQFVSRGMS